MPAPDLFTISIGLVFFLFPFKKYNNTLQYPNIVKEKKIFNNCQCFGVCDPIALDIRSGLIEIESMQLTRTSV